MTVPPPPPATLRLRVDREALAHNWRTLDAMSGDARAGAAVKADAYGVGVDIAVPVLADAGAREFFLAHWSEVPAMLAHVDGSSLAVLHGVTSEADASFARATGVLPVINSLHQARLWTETGGGPCHLMVDTGINRLGVPTDALGDPAIGALQVGVLMSHLASADEHTPQNARQLARFREATGAVDAKAHSLANSAGIALGNEYHFDLTRPGIALYGGVVHPLLSDSIRQVVSLEAAILQTREIEAGDCVGYNARFTADRAMRVATVSIGYADGFLRSWAGAARFVHDDRELPVLGRISMDMVVVDCTDIPVREGDFLTVPYSLPEASAASGLSQYELLTILGHRFDRI